MQVGRLSEERADKPHEPPGVVLGGLVRGRPPSQVDGGDVEDDAFKPEDHEETLRERTVADAFSITAGL